MSQSAIPATGEERRQAEAQASQEVEEAQPKKLDALHTEYGDTTIADGVVAKIAGIAAREVSGVFAMGSAAGRALGNLTRRIQGDNQSNNASGGVSVEKGEYQTAIDVSVVVEYGAAIVEVSEQIRENVIRAVESGTGLEVVSVDVNVSDVHLPEDDQDDAGSVKSNEKLA